jgi:hypothetical protein
MFHRRYVRADICPVKSIENYYRPLTKRYNPLFIGLPSISDFIEAF